VILLNLHTHSVNYVIVTINRLFFYIYKNIDNEIISNIGIIIFGWIRFLFKKITKLILKKTKTSSNRPILVRFDFLEQKPVQTGLTRFFSGLGSIMFF